MDAVIYTRVSHDASGRGRSVDEQEKECRATAADHGWNVRQVVSDISIGASRHSAVKSRPGFEQLRHELRRGDVLVVWESSRLTRKLGEYLAIRELCESRQVLLCVGDEITDFSKSSDRSRSASEALAAEAEADKTSDRVRRNVRARATSGDAHSVLPFGYVRTYDPATGAKSWSLDPVNAPLVRDAVEGVLSGRTLYSIATDWNARGILTGNGNLWQPRTVKQLLRRPALAGLRQYQGQVIGAGNWPPIITTDQHQRLLAVFTDPTRIVHRGHKPVHLLTGIATCSRCGDTMRYLRHSGKKDQYRCPSGCVGRSAGPVDDWVLSHMFRLIDLWRANVFLMQDDSPTSSPTASLDWAEARELQQRLDAFTDQAIDGTISNDQLARATKKLQPQIDAAKDRARRNTIHPLLKRLGESPNSIWESWDIEEQRQLIKNVISVVIYPTEKGRRSLDPETVKVTWRGDPIMPPDGISF